jgi:hypothetical protein
MLNIITKKKYCVKSSNRTFFAGQNSSHTDFVGLYFIEKYSVRLLLTSKLKEKSQELIT